MRALKAKYVAYRNLSCLEFINKLKINCYNITPSSLKDNSTRMTYIYNINQLFETFIGQVEMAVDLVDARGVPYAPE